MIITEEDISRFIQAWQQDFGETLDRDTGREEATKFFTLFYELSKPRPDEAALYTRNLYTQAPLYTDRYTEEELDLSEPTRLGYEYICDTIRETGRQPSFRNIMEKVGYGSPRSVRLLIDRLVDRGLITYVDGVMGIVEMRKQSSLLESLHMETVKLESMTIDIPTSITQLIRPANREEVTKLLRDGQIGIYANTLNQGRTVYELFAFGFDQIDRVGALNIQLSKFFFVLSSFENLPEAAEDLASEAMIYFEGEQDLGLSLRSAQLKKRFLQLSPETMNQSIFLYLL